MNTMRTAALLLLAGSILTPTTAADASGGTYGDNRPCVTGREFNHLGGLHQTRADVARIVDTNGVRVSRHTFDGWNADAGVKPRDEYGAPFRYRQIRRYPTCPGMRHGYGARHLWIEFLTRPGHERVEQIRVGRP